MTHSIYVLWHQLFWKKFCVSCFCGSSQHRYASNFKWAGLKEEILRTTTHISLWVKLNEELLAFEAQLADLRPRECVDLCQHLEDEDSHVCDGEVQRHSLVVLQKQSNHKSMMWCTTLYFNRQTIIWWQSPPAHSDVDSRGQSLH